MWFDVVYRSVTFVMYVIVHEYALCVGYVECR